MPQSARDARLETRSARLKLKSARRYFKAIGPGLSLAYRRTNAGYGTWSAKVALPSGKYALYQLGSADDFQEANGSDLLSFYQAQDAARKLSDEMKHASGVLARPATVADASARYLDWYEKNRRAVMETRSCINAHILPTLGLIAIRELTAARLRHWLDALALRPARVRSAANGETRYRAAPSNDDEKRARRATANRVLNVLKAILNRAFHDGLVRDDTEWRKVKPFAKADEARLRFLDGKEAARLVNACAGDFRQLVQAALLTGARFGELQALEVRDVNLRTGQVLLSGRKSNKPRYVPLNPAGVALFSALTLGKSGDCRIFVKADGAPWGKNHHVRPLHRACEAAKVAPRIAFHELRHTYASHLAQAGVDLLTISKLLGHADVRITAKHYAHLCDRTLANAVLKLPSFHEPEALLSLVA